MSNKSTRFSSSNQPTRGRGKGERTKFLEAMQRQSHTEDDFYDLIVNQAMTEKLPLAMAEILRRISPVPKPVAPPVEFNLDKDATPHQKAGQILDAISSGDIPPDIGVTLISSIKAFVDIEEFTELKKRIEKLEELLDAGLTK